jgi:signal transduction histidine kinase
MKGFAQLLLRRAERVPGGDEWRSGLQTIDMQVNRVSELVNRLLDVSRIEERRLQLETAPVDVVEIVRGAAAEVRLTSEQHRIVVRAGRKRQLASVDRMRIEQVLFNLLDNAIKYSPAGTTVEVAVSDAADEVVVSVHDQGDGIPPDVRERLFERYFRGAGSARAASEGLGLGLYVAHGIVDAHGGRMWLESDVGHGSTFAFSLPRLTQASTVAAPIDARSAEATAE